MIMVDKNGIICEYDGHVVDLSKRTKPERRWRKSKQRKKNSIVS
jgi:hypothetical protein